MHDKVQEKAFQEVQEFFKSSNDLIQLSDVSKLTYIEMIIKESMRLFPAGSMLGRTTTGEVKLGKDQNICVNRQFLTFFLIENHVIPPDTMVVINVLKIHRNVDIWGNDANMFVPERFEEDNFQKIHPYAFLPFAGKFFIRIKILKV